MVLLLPIAEKHSTHKNSSQLSSGLHSHKLFLSRGTKILPWQKMASEFHQKFLKEWCKAEGLSLSTTAQPVVK